MNEKFEKNDIWCDVVVLSFHKNIKYDYPIPSTSDVTERARRLCKSDIGLPGHILDNLWKLIWRQSKDDYCQLEDYMRLCDYIFGSEWFYGFGTLLRWRPGEREKALKRIEKWINKEDKKYISIIWNFLSFKSRGEHEFKSHDDLSRIE